ncbi:MAG: DUF5916 domain-containing protein [Rhodothermales bacterium]
MRINLLKRQNFIALAITLIVLPCTVFAQVSNRSDFLFSKQAPTAPVHLQRITSPIEIDGHINEAAWADIVPFPLVTYQPTYRGTKSERTEIRVAYDDNYLYAAGHFYVEDLDDMRGNSFYRDGWSGDDTFGLLLDTFNDNESALWFYTTPLGIRADGLVVNDAETGPNFDWNSFWDSAAIITEDGWFAEMRIPFNSLAFQQEDNQTVFGLSVYRWLTTTNERHVYPDISPAFNNGFRKPSLMQDVILEGIHRRNPVYVSPYGLTGVNQFSELNDAGSGYELDRNLTNELGLDLKYNLTPNLTLDVSANTDFAQVEADDQQINLTRFSLFFPEKRQFFQERSGIFEFDTGETSSRLFHSRRIGLVNGQPIRILGGARVVGRLKDWDVGLLNMQTARQDGLPTENFGVLRLRRKAFNDYSTVGGMVTSRVDEEGSYNVVYGLDGIVRIIGDEYLTLKWAQSFDEAHVNGANYNPINAGRAVFNWTRRKIQGLNYDLGITWSGADYLPDMGFTRRSDFTYVSPDINYQVFKDESSRFRRIWIGNWASTYFRNSDGSIESFWTHPFYWFELKHGATFLISTDHYYEDVREPFSIGEDTAVPDGSYWFHDVWLSAEGPEGWQFRPEATLISGSFYDGWRTSLSPGVSWNVSKHLELGVDYELNIIRFPDRNQRLNAHLPRIRVQAALNRHFSAASFVQYNSLTDRMNINTRLRYHFREGNDLWIVYNEGVNADRTQMIGPRLPVTESRTVLLKYTHTFIW